MLAFQQRPPVLADLDSRKKKRPLASLVDPYGAGTEPITYPPFLRRDAPDFPP